MFTCFAIIPTAKNKKISDMILALCWLDSYHLTFCSSRGSWFFWLIRRLRRARKKKEAFQALTISSLPGTLPSIQCRLLLVPTVIRKWATKHTGIRVNGGGVERGRKRGGGGRQQEGERERGREKKRDENIHVRPR